MTELNGTGKLENGAVNTPANALDEKLKKLIIDLQAASISGDTDKILAISSEIAKYKKEIMAAKVEALKKENELLAGKRLELGIAIQKAIVGISGGIFTIDGLNKDQLQIVANRMREAIDNLKANIGKMNELKVTGFTFNLDLPDASGAIVERKSVGLIHPQNVEKVHRTGGGNQGATKTSTGMTLDEIFKAHATEENKAAFDKEIEDSKVEVEAINLDSSRTDEAKKAAVQARTKTCNSRTWAIKNKVKEQALKDGKITVK
jgi:hypothetical protein